MSGLLNRIRIGTSLAGFLLTVGSSIVYGQGEVSAVRTALDKWVETRQLISREKRDWAEQKEAIEQTSALYQREIERLNGEIEEAKESNSQVTKEMAEQDAENITLKAAGEVSESLITETESKLKALVAKLPIPLQDKIDPFVRRIPEDPEETKTPLAQRMQSIIGILNEVEKFNGSVSVFSEIRKNPSGADVSVKTLYLGLGQAYFVDTEGTFAGVGTPSASGWNWVEKTAQATAIADAIAVYENAKPAAFVNLPVSVK